MFRSLRKAAQSLGETFDTTFSNAPPSHTAFTNTILSFDTITLRLGSVFAEGGYSFIHKAYLHPQSSLSQNNYFAVKRISCTDSESTNQAKHEAQILSKCSSHPNIVKFYGVVFHQQHAFLAMELLDGGLLSELITRPNPPNPLMVLQNITNALVHLHSQQPPIASRDLKLENVLYDRLSSSFKICDLGSATTDTIRPDSRQQILNITDDIEANCTAMYRAPEIANLYSKQFICEKIDIWALGCIWYALLFKKLPFDGQSSLQIAKGITNIPSTPKHPPSYIKLLYAMLQVDPAKRIDSFTLLEAILLLQGEQIDPQIKQKGLQLYQKRANDFCKQNESAVMPPTVEQLLEEEISSNTLSVPADSRYAQGTFTEKQYSIQSATREQINTVKSSTSDTKSLINFDDVFDNCNTQKVSPITTSSSTGNTSNNLTTLLPQSTAISKNSTTSRSNAVDQDDDWADFESAFGDNNSTATNSNLTFTQQLQPQPTPVAQSSPSFTISDQNNPLAILEHLKTPSTKQNTTNSSRLSTNPWPTNTSGISATTQSTLTSSLAAMNLQSDKPSTSTNPEFQHINSSLIDFADFSSFSQAPSQINSTTSKPDFSSQSSQSSKSRFQQPNSKSNDSNRAADFTDLIDFN